MEEVKAPLYGYRVYGSQVVGGNKRVLTPVHMKWMIDGMPNSCTVPAPVVDATLITVDLFDWSEASQAPEIESDFHIWTRTNSEYWMGEVEDWWPVSEHPNYLADDEAAMKRQEIYARLRGGIHSFKEKRHAFDYARYFRGPLQSFAGVPVLAKIEISGIVVEHEHGYRSERSRIIELYMFAGDEVRARVAQQLGWPFEIGAASE